MNPSLLDLTSLVSGSAGLVTTFSLVVAIIRNRVVAKEDLAKLRDELEERALSSSNIDVVGAYIFDNIGTVHIRDCVRDDKIWHRTRKAMRRMSDFLARDTDDELPQVPTIPDVSSLDESDELVRAERDIRAGEIWNGLARVRRLIEKRLREAIPISSDKRIGVSRLVSLADKSDKLQAEGAHHLGYVVTVANKAIHGEDVSVDVALEALQSARYGLASVKRDG